MLELQRKVGAFNDARDWSKDAEIKDLLLNMSEEIGEFWNIIKWVPPEVGRRLIEENRAEAENFIGDMLYLVLKIAHICGIDSEKALIDVLDEYEQRFPVARVRGGHGNPLAGGVDLKADVRKNK
ncbi:hypothetical protein JXB02_01355 [Candidatus Woesearchaeota archaeon]|nr:hypothetical protein [Candidatus Woesearchaeota archaeon]